MDFSKKIISLRRTIRQFMQIHKSPHDTSAFQQMAAQLNDLETKLKQKPNAPSSSIQNSVGENGTNNVADVKIIQQLLKKQGISISVDGDAGPATIQAIKYFQASVGAQNPDGRVDPNGFTWGKLKESSAPKTNTKEETTSSSSESTATTPSTIQASVGSNGSNNVVDVKIIQQLLKDKGASISVDGDAGPATIQAIKDFQASVGAQNPDGRVDPNGFTWNKLQETSAPDTNTKDDSTKTSDTSTETSTPDTNTKDDSTETPEPTTNNKTIKASVGKNGKNNVADVKTIQQLLNDKGASLSLDGDAGPSTIRAIKDFQISVGVTNPDGRVDPDGFTWQELNKKSVNKNNKSDSPQKTATASSKVIKASVGKNGANNSDDVKIVQELLNTKENSLKVDGLIGSGTIQAIMDFQTVIKLTDADIDGLIEPNSFTWKNLIKEGLPTLDRTKITTGDESIPEELSVTSKIKKSVGAKGVNLPEDVILVRKLLLKFNFTLEETTPIVTVPLLSAIKKFQKDYVGSSRPDSRIDPNGKTWNTLLGIGRIRGGIYDVAKKFGIEPAVILAIQAVESGGNGFLADGRPKILFEGHIFWRELKKVGKDPAALRPGNENIIYPKWVKSNYKFNEKEYDRLALAEKIDKTAALKSASWGEFQIMGFNHASAGYSDVESFVESMYKPGVNQLNGLMGFLKENNLLRHVQGNSKNWAALAKGYNGPAYAKNKYDIKLANAYERFSKII